MEEKKKVSKNVEETKENVAEEKEAVEKKQEPTFVDPWDMILFGRRRPIPQQPSPETEQSGPEENKEK